MGIFKAQHRAQLLQYWEYEIEQDVDCIRAVENSVSEYKQEYKDAWIDDFVAEYLADREKRMSS